MIYFELTLACLVFSGTFIAGRILSVDIPPYTAGFFRFACASVIFLLFCVTREKIFPKLSVKMWALVVLLGFTGVFAYNICFLQGLHSVQAGRASIIIASNPIVASIFAAFIYKERFSIKKLLGILFALCGVIMAITNGRLGMLLNAGVSYGDMLILGAVLCWVGYQLIGKYVMRELPVFYAVMLSCIFGMLMLLPCAWLEGGFSNIGQYSVNSWLAVIYLAVFGTVVGFLLYYKGIDKIGVSRASVFINFVPVFAILSGWLFLEETITVYLCLGAMLVVAGVYITNRSK